MERRLAAILAVDVVGYSALMERDETGTFARLREHRKQLFEPEIKQHHGRIFKLTGDGIFAEFGSVIDAVECAVNLQRGMAERNANEPNAKQIVCRIAINLGDVIVEGRDRYGDGINVAARLQQLAEPGGISVTQTVVDHVKNKLALRFEWQGEHRVKNIAEPIKVYHILEGAAPSGLRARGRRSALRDVAVTVVLVLIALTGGWVWYANYWGSTRETGQGIPVIAVMPFLDLTGDQTINALGKGIAETFLSDLATFPDYEVVSATTSFAFADRPLSDIVKETGATFVVEGSVRRATDKLKVTMQLIRGNTDRHLMITEIEEPLTEPVSLQRSVVNRLRDELGGMTGVLRKASNNIALAKADANLTEYDYYILGHIRQFKGQDGAAVEIYTKGLQRFPDSVLLRCKLVFIVTNEKLVNEARKLRKKSRLDEWYLHWASAWVESHKNPQRAVAEAEATIALAPYDTVSRMSLSQVLMRAGQKEKAMAWATFAMRHDPNPLSWYPEILIATYRSAGKLTELIELAEHESKTRPQPKGWYLVLWKAYASTGQKERPPKHTRLPRAFLLRRWIDIGEADELPDSFGPAKCIYIR